MLVSKPKSYHMEPEPEISIHTVEIPMEEILPTQFEIQLEVLKNVNQWT